MKSQDSLEWGTVKTTLPVYPLPPNHERRAIITENLILRPFNDDEHDLEGLHAVRAESEVMKWSIQGRPDKDAEETRANTLAMQLPPNDGSRYNFAICLASTGEVVGIGGIGKFNGAQGWPEVGYMLHPKTWGNGYATEFLSAFLDAWWELPRKQVELKVDENTVRGEGEMKDEFISAITDYDNAASHRVLQKAGFELSTEWTEDDLRDLTKKITLHGFISKNLKIGGTK